MKQQDLIMVGGIAAGALLESGIANGARRIPGLDVLPTAPEITLGLLAGVGVGAGVFERKGAGWAAAKGMAMGMSANAAATLFSTYVPLGPVDVA